MGGGEFASMLSSQVPCLHMDLKKVCEVSTGVKVEAVALSETSTRLKMLSGDVPMH